MKAGVTNLSRNVAKNFPEKASGSTAFAGTHQHQFDSISSEQ
jgi:hypothetical protein